MVSFERVPGFSRLLNRCAVGVLICLALPLVLRGLLRGLCPVGGTFVRSQCWSVPRSEGDGGHRA